MKKLSTSSDNGGVQPRSTANSVNPKALDYLFSRNQTRTVGTVRMDFPGAGLISAIIAHNMKGIQTPSTTFQARADFHQMWKDICYSADDGRSSASARVASRTSRSPHQSGVRHWHDLFSPRIWFVHIRSDEVFSPADIAGNTHACAKRLNVTSRVPCAPDFIGSPAPSMSCALPPSALQFDSPPDSGALLPGFRARRIFHG